MLGCGLDLVSPNVAQQTSVLCKHPYLVYAPRPYLKPGRTRDHVGQLSAQLRALQVSKYESERPKRMERVTRSQSIQGL
jgi:hypothetical protein